MKVKITQNWPVRHQGTLYGRGSELDVDEQTAAWLIAKDRAVEVKSNTSNNSTCLTPEEQAVKEAERKAAIVKAITELQTATPNEVPSCNKIKEKSGYAIKVEERDLILAELKNETQE